MAKSRVVLPELLDELPPQDKSALRSRRDLRRLNAWMRHAPIMAQALKKNWPGSERAPVVELGAGDGHFLLSVAGRLNGFSHGANCVLVDRLETVDPQVFGRFQNLGWNAQFQKTDVVDWLRQGSAESHSVILSNLFFHQFKDDKLAEMLGLAANKTRMVIALEPRRSWQSRICGRLLWAIGCNSVTRHDAQVSIDAGFADKELSRLWPDKENWQLTEKPVGLFSHLFIARRKE